MTNILLADGNELVREGIVSLLENFPGNRVVARCSNGRQAVQEVDRIRPDLALIDLSLPELNGIDAARQISRTRNRNRTRVILMLGYEGEVSIAEMAHAGVSGYVVKEGSLSDLGSVVREPGRTMNQLARRADGSLLHPGVERRSNELTNREREILQLIGEGNSSKQIATKLNISSTTVKTHRDNIMEKLDAHDIAGLTRASICLKLVSADYRRPVSQF
jgi:two-component system, NarL family, response regulator NreC